MDVPDIIPPVELRGSEAEKVKTLDAVIVRLEALRSAAHWRMTAAVAPPSDG